MARPGFEPAISRQLSAPYPIRLTIRQRCFSAGQCGIALNDAHANVNDTLSGLLDIVYNSTGPFIKVVRDHGTAYNLLLSVLVRSIKHLNNDAIL